MKKTALFLLALALTASTGYSQVREVQVTLGLAEGGNPQGFIQGSNPQGVMFATASGGQARSVPYAQIRGEGIDKLIRFEERAEILADARAAFSEGRYDEAADAFGEVARNYAIVLYAPRNFATEALFYQMESLRRAGKFGTLGSVAETEQAKTIETTMDETHRRAYQFMRLWGMLGAKKMDDLKAAIGAYEETVTGNAKLLPAPNFQDLPAGELYQLAYLRAEVYKAEGEKDKALDDYYRSFTLANGNDDFLAKLAMGAAMVIQLEDPALAKKNAQAVGQMQSIAYLFSQRYGADIMPEQFREYAVRPPMTRPAPAPEEAPKENPEEAPKEGEKAKEAKPAEGEKGKAETPKEEGKANGKGKK